MLGALKRLKVSGLAFLNLTQTLFPFKDNKSSLFFVDSFQQKVFKSTFLHISVPDLASL